MTSPSPRQILVAICTANRSAYLTNILERLAEVDFSTIPNSQIGVLIVDNAPGGDTANILAQARDRLSVRLDLVEEPQRGISEARNRAAQETLARNAHLLAFIDDDDLPEADWLAELIKKYDETGADIVMGNRRRPSGYAIDPAEPHSQVTLWKPNGLPDLLSTCNVLINTRILETLAREGPIFDPVFSSMGGGDADFFVRARKAGATFTAAPRSIIDFRVEGARSSFHGGIRRKLKGGCSQGTLARKYVKGRFKAAWLTSLAWRSIRDLLLLLPDFALNQRKAKSLQKLAWDYGAFYGFLGGQIAYYNEPKIHD